MKELNFVSLRSADWDLWDRWLSVRHAARQPGVVSLPSTSATFPASELPRRYRTLCHDLALARDRNYSSILIDRLQHRVLLAHQRLYGSRSSVWEVWLAFLVRDFPTLVRREFRVVLFAAALLFLPALVLGIVTQSNPDAIYLVAPAAQVAQMESMYEPGNPRLGRPREARQDWSMYAFYIANNVKIDFQCFAGGIVFGIGSVFYLVYNGLMLGGVAGHLTRMGYIQTFWGFVAGHSGFELIGAVFSGAAGLKLGWALIAPGPRTRGAAIRANASIAVRLLYGAATLTFLAAFVEAFWSPLTTIPVMVKYGVGVLVWGSLLSYFLFVGRWSKPATESAS